MFKKYLKYTYKSETLVPFKALPLWLDAAIPASLLLLEALSEIFNGNADKGRQRFSLNLCKVGRTPPFQILVHPWEQKKVAWSEVVERGVGGCWDSTTILFLAKREAFCCRRRGSTRIAGGPWQHFRWRFQTMFPAVGAALGSLHPVTGGVPWRGLKFQTFMNILNKFL